jgi:hypothetical protein
MEARHRRAQTELYRKANNGCNLQKCDIIAIGGDYLI